MPINIHITAGPTAEASTVEVSGQDISLISDEERLSFKLSEDELSQAVATHENRRPSGVYLRDHPIFQKYGWVPTQRVFTVESAEIISMETEPVALASHRYENQRASGATSHSATLSHATTVSASTTWSSSVKLSMEQKIVYSVGLDQNKVGAETRFGFEAQYGQGGTQSKAATITSINAVTFSLDPGQAATAVLAADRGTLRIQVHYIASLQGNCFADYEGTHKGHHYWCLPIESIMAESGLENSHRISQIIDVGFYADSRVTVRDELEQEDMEDIGSAPAELIMD